jgi:hypothetical protein
MRLDDTKDKVVQAFVAQITVDGIIGLDCLRSNAGLIDLQNSMLEVDGKRVSLKYAGKLGCFRVVAHDKASLIRKLPRPILFNLLPLSVKTS